MSSDLWSNSNEPIIDDSVIDISKLQKSKANKQDKYIRCRDCDASFLFSIEEQNYFKNRKLEHTPSRCHNCRVLRKAQSSKDKENSVSAIICISCKSLTYVPFKPKGHSPIYCRICMHKKRRAVI